MTGGRRLLLGVCVLVGCSSGGSSDANHAAGGSGGSGGTATVGVGGSSGAAAAGGSVGVAGGVTATPPLVSDPNGNFPSRLQVSAGYLYWLSGTHRIVRAAVDGTQAKTIFTHAGSNEQIIAIGGFAVDATSLYFTDEGDGAATDRGVYKIALDGSGMTTMLTPATQPAGLALDGDTLCFEDGGDLRQVKTSGDSPLTLLHGGLDYRTVLVVSQGFVYFQAAFGADAQDVYRLPLGVADPSASGAAAGAGGTAAGAGGASGATAGGAAGGGASGAAAGGAAHNGAQKISAVPGRYDILLAPRADNNDIYWGVEETIYKWAGGSGGASAVAVVTDSLDVQNTAPPHGVLVPFDGTLYWVGGAGTIFKQQLPSGKRTAVASASANSIALDGTYLYAAVNKAIARFTP